MTEETRFTAQEYGILLNWFMVSDPWPLEKSSMHYIKDMLDEEAQARGYEDWVEAYHEFSAD